MATHNVTMQVSTPIGVIGGLQTFTATGEASLDAETVPVATDTLMNIAFPYATIKSVIILATCTCQIETNATNAAGGDTLQLTANVPYIWNNTMEAAKFPNPFSANVTKWYVTAVATGLIYASILYDPTP